MATKQAKKKATRKTAQPARAPRKTAKKKTGQEGEEKATAAVQEDGRKPEAKAAPRKRTPKLDKKKLGEMVDKMLLQLAEHVEGGECKITTSEAVRLIQLREALGLEKPSAVKVEWVEPKAE